MDIYDIRDITDTRIIFYERTDCLYWLLCTFHDAKLFQIRRRSTQYRRACTKSVINVEEASEVCRGRNNRHYVVSAILERQKAWACLCMDFNQLALYYPFWQFVVIFWKTALTLVSKSLVFHHSWTYTSGTVVRVWMGWVPIAKALSRSGFYRRLINQTQQNI